jgi:uncharacterized protein with von Willebrand factor type A (vWA) domain
MEKIVLRPSSHGAGRVDNNKISKDTLDILVFGNDAWTIAIKDLPYLKVGPFHTNTVAGLQLAMDCEEKEYQQTNFMITDGKPSCS